MLVNFRRHQRKQRIEVLNLNLHSKTRELRPRGRETDFIEWGIATKTTTATTKLFQTSTHNGGRGGEGTERDVDWGRIIKKELEIESVWNVWLHRWWAKMGSEDEWNEAWGVVNKMAAQRAGWRLMLGDAWRWRISLSRPAEGACPRSSTRCEKKRAGKMQRRITNWSNEWQNILIR